MSRLPDYRLLPALILSLSFAAAPPLLAAERTLTIVAFGDSTTAPRQGVEKVYPQRLEELLAARGYQAKVVNAGVGGNTTAAAVERYQNDVIAHRPDMVIIQFGLNDSAVDVSEGKQTPRLALHLYERNLNNLLRDLAWRSVRVILMTPNPMLWTDARKARYSGPPYDHDDRWGANPLNQHYAAAVRRIADAHDVPLVDVYRFFETYDAVEGQSAEDLMSDGAHPNDRGHAIIAALLAGAIDQQRQADDDLATVGFGDDLQILHTPAPPRGYTIPLIDLADEKHRQVIVDREEGQYLGHPTTVLLEDGKTIITVYPKGHGRGAIVMKRSHDGGLTWSERLPVPDNWATSKEVPTLHRVVDAQGNKRLIMFSGLSPVRMAVSEDDGWTWTPLEPVGAWGGIVTMGCVAKLKTPGEYMALFHDDGRFFSPMSRRENPSRMTLYKTFSTDGGLTWGKPQAILGSTEVHPCEPGVFRSPDGSQLAVLLRENTRRRNSLLITSEDEGRTWSKPRELPAALTGDRHTGVYAPDGRLFISFRDTTLESPTRGDWVAWVGTYEDIIEGREGQYRVRLMDNHHVFDCAYPGVEILPDGTIVTTTYGHWTQGQQPYIVSVRLKLEELDGR